MSEGQYQQEAEADSKGMSTMTKVLIGGGIGAFLLVVIVIIIVLVVRSRSNNTSEEEEAIRQEEVMRQEETVRRQGEAEEMQKQEEETPPVPPEPEEEELPPPCVLDCKNSGNAERGDDGECRCKCIGDWSGADCGTLACDLSCKNGGKLTAGADGKCKCECVGEWMGPECVAPVPNTKTASDVATDCKNKAGYFWNGYDCIPAKQECGCKTEAGFGKPKCVCSNGGTTGFCYAKVGGTRNDWNRGTDAKCCAAAAHGDTKVGDPAPWGGAGCVWSGTMADCEARLAKMGCN